MLLLSLWNVLKNLNLLKNGDSSKEIRIVFDNCSGKNKNNSVLKLAPIFVALGYFNTVEFSLIGCWSYQKLCWHSFQCVESIYWVKDSHSMEELCQQLHHSKRISIHNTEENDFHDCDKSLSRLYSNLAGKTKPNHIFSANEQLLEMNSIITKARLVMTIKESDLQVSSVVEHDHTKQCLERRIIIRDWKFEWYLIIMSNLQKNKHWKYWIYQSEFLEGFVAL